MPESVCVRFGNKEKGRFGASGLLKRVKLEAANLFFDE